MSRTQILRSLSDIANRLLPDCPSKPRISISFRFTSSASNSTSISSPLFNFLTVELNLPRSKALSISISTRYSSVKLLDKPKAVVHYLRSIGFTDSEIASAAQGSPNILFSDIGKSLEPKIKLFQDLGLIGPQLCSFLAKNSSVLRSSMNKCLVPNLQLLIKILGAGDPNQKKWLPTVINRCNRIVGIKNSKLLKVIEFLQSCGIVGSQLTILLKTQPRVFAVQESKLRGLVSDVIEMGFSTDSRMFVYGVLCISAMSKATLKRKMELFASMGFSENYCLEMLKRQPSLFKASEEKITKGMDFFLNTAKLDAKYLVSRPHLLKLSLEERVIPRYRLLQVLKANNLLKKDPKLGSVLCLTEERFLARYLLKFDQKDELLKVYGSHLLEKDRCSESS